MNNFLSPEQKDKVLSHCAELSDLNDITVYSTEIVSLVPASHELVRHTFKEFEKLGLIDSLMVSTNSDYRFDFTVMPRAYEFLHSGGFVGLQNRSDEQAGRKLKVDKAAIVAPKLALIANAISFAALIISIIALYYSLSDKK